MIQGRFARREKGKNWEHRKKGKVIDSRLSMIYRYFLELWEKDEDTIASLIPFVSNTLSK